MKRVEQDLHAPAARALGDPEARIERVVLDPGFVTKLDFMKIVQEAKPDAVLCGEGCEWEAFEYAEDWITAGWGKAMIMTGIAAAQDAAAGRIAAWLQTLNLGVPVSFFATGTPFSTVSGDRLMEQES